MTDFCQGDVIKISGFKDKYMIISNDSFIKNYNCFHICPIIQSDNESPIHPLIKTNLCEGYLAICEQIKLIDPQSRACSKISRLDFSDIQNISDIVQGLFEYI